MTLDPNAPEPLVSSSDDAELRALLAAGRDELPNEAQLSALAAKLDPILGPGSGGGHGGAGGAPGAAAKGAAGATLAKLLGATALVILVGGAAVHAIRSRAPADTSGVRPAVNVAVTAASVEAPAPLEVPPSPVPSSSKAARTATPSAPVRASATAARPTASSTAPEDPDAEVKLVQDAQGALRSDPARTLSLCAEHARRFPNGLMAQEREVLAIEALVQTGRTDDARARADHFAASYPSSTHLRRIRAVLGDAP